MKNLEIALCDSCQDYILKVASFLLNQMEVGVHVFTTPESFYVDENDYDVTILTQEFEEISEFKSKGRVGHKYYLTEEQIEEREDSIYKYQSVKDIIDGITELKEKKNLGANTRKSIGNSKIIGVYSPIAHELQLPFSMALGQAYGTEGKVLFLDIEEISVLPNLVGRNCEKNLLDLLYELDTAQSSFNLKEYVRSFMGFDYVQPFANPNEISEIEQSTWERFFEMLSKADYDVIVVLFGRTINGFNSYIRNMDKLFVLGKPGDYFRKTQENFLDYMDRIGSVLELENVILPMSAGNLSDGTYHIEELLHGNLGIFVKKLVRPQAQSA